MGIPAPSVVAYDDVHAEQRMRDYWVTLHKNWKGVTVRGAPRTQEMIIGEQTLTINAARRLVFDRVASAASCDSLMLNPSGKLPSVTVAAGIETVGFYTLQDALAYLAVRLPATYAAVRASFAAIAEARADFAPKTVLDIGAGPGTALWAAADCWPDLADVLLVEASPVFRACGEALNGGARARPRV